MAIGAIGDIKFCLVGRESQSVGLVKISYDCRQFAIGWIQTIDILRRLFWFCLIAFVIGEDSIGWISKPDRAIRTNNHIVGRIQLLAVETICQDSDAAIDFGAGNATAAMLASDEPTLTITTIPIGKV